MGQRNKTEVGGDTRDINVCRVDECNHDLSTTDDLLYLHGQNTNYNRLRKTF